jgi:hypothetical protein
MREEEKSGDRNVAESHTLLFPSESGSVFCSALSMTLPMKTAEARGNSSQGASVRLHWQALTAEGEAPIKRTGKTTSKTRVPRPAKFLAVIMNLLMRNTRNITETFRVFRLFRAPRVPLCS